MAVDKAVDSKALDTMFKNIGNAIREKDGTTALITPGNMPAKIRAIQTGVDTSDATATASDIASGKTAYVKGEKVTGELLDSFQIDVGSVDQREIPYSTPDGFVVEGLCSVSGNTIINDNTTARTYILIPGDAPPDSVLEGATFSSSEGIEVTGTMPNNGAADIQISNLGLVDVAEGYYSGGTAGIADAEVAKIIPENIKKGITILGVAGSMSGTEGANAQAKTATPSFSEQVISPDTTGGYNYLSQVTVKPIPVSYVDNEQGGQTVTVG